MSCAALARLDVHRKIASIAAGLAIAGAVYDHAAVNLVATYSMMMYAMYPGYMLHELAACFLAGFVFSRGMTSPALVLYAAAYALFTGVLFARGTGCDGAQVAPSSPSSPDPEAAATLGDECKVPVNADDL